MISAKILDNEHLINQCPMCGKTSTLLVNEHIIDELYNKNAYIQVALDGYTAAEREFVMTEYCPSCQSSLFGQQFKYTKRWKEV